LKPFDGTWSLNCTICFSAFRFNVSTSAPNGLSGAQRPGQMQQEVQHQIPSPRRIAAWWAAATQHFGGARLGGRLHHQAFLHRFWVKRPRSDGKKPWKQRADLVGNVRLKGDCISVNLANV
jgi:hypothetical protein